ncbi:MAG: hypothetical protein LAT79_14915 [Kiritimatiellae bacterium]|nr:hypothetical protein [Kiritimatiellia bacterium]
MTADTAYNRKVAAQAAALGVDTVHFSHTLCHHADDLMDSPERAAKMRDLLRMYRGHDIKVWCWTHEVKHPPAHLVEDGKLLADEDALYSHLEKKYATFFQETLPGLEGLVLTFAETQFPVYQEDRIKSALDRGARTERLIRHMHGIYRKSSVGIVMGTPPVAGRFVCVWTGMPGMPGKARCIRPGDTFYCSRPSPLKPIRTSPWTNFGHRCPGGT